MVVPIIFSLITCIISSLHVAIVQTVATFISLYHGTTGFNNIKAYQHMSRNLIYVYRYLTAKIVSKTFRVLNNGFSVCICLALVCLLIEKQVPDLYIHIYSYFNGLSLPLVLYKLFTVSSSPASPVTCYHVHDKLLLPRPIIASC